MNILSRFAAVRRGLLFGLLGLGLLAGVPAQAQTLEKVKKSGELRIGVAPGDPWYYRDPATGQWTGVGVLMGEQIAKNIGVKMVPVETTWANSVAGLQSGQFDVMFVLDATEERKRAIDFPAAPMLWYAQGVLAKDGLVVKNWSDLDKPTVRVGVALGTATDRDLTKRLPNAKIERFTNTDETVAAFNAGRVDAIGFYHSVLTIAYSKIKKGSVQIPQPVVAIATSAGVRKEQDPAFRDMLDEQFKKLYASGQTQALYAQYLKTKGLDPDKMPGVTKESLEK
ncbi:MULTISPECIES: transporter substrate-binding domain-containing protein [Pseudacidovorax]|mgnify:CR=1 FL=1|uniref:transporter substrate-binding domain-containing protein n=1 Tax=Pseudacidovorax TaxID=433923 RepID=UPI000953D4AF|nr:MULTISPECIES: transporter substrate-binding domain-containing protein [Pseudacidovorax]SIQ57180.1 amino acid ABC transporter substrate-binding protein, PAAT family [Pseudacidovorax sp. RU35E]